MTERHCIEFKTGDTMPLFISVGYQTNYRIRYSVQTSNQFGNMIPLHCFLKTCKYNILLDQFKTFLYSRKRTNYFLIVLFLWLFLKKIHCSSTLSALPLLKAVTWQLEQIAYVRESWLAVMTGSSWRHIAYLKHVSDDILMYLSDDISKDVSGDQMEAIRNDIRQLVLYATLYHETRARSSERTSQ